MGTCGQKGAPSAWWETPPGEMAIATGAPNGKHKRLWVGCSVQPRQPCSRVGKSLGTGEV